MRTYRRWLLYVGILALVVIPAWMLFQDGEMNRAHRIERNKQFSTQAEIHINKNDQLYRKDMKLNQKTRDEILTKDLSLTTSFFITQLQRKLKQWSQQDFTDKQGLQELEQELHEHKHFHAFALVKGDETVWKSGRMKEEDLTYLQERWQEGKKSTVYSRPYVKNGEQYMLIAVQNKNGEWCVGEIALSFIKGFVGELASVADANGNLFISSDTQKKIQWDSKEKKDGYVTQKVPELDWQIIMQAEGEQEDQRHYQDGEAIVQFASERGVEQWLEQNPDYKVKKRSGRFVILEHGSLSTKEILSSLYGKRNILSVEPNYIFTKQADLQSAEQKHRQAEKETEATQPIQPNALSKNEMSRRNRQKVQAKEKIKAQEGVLPNDEFYEPYQWNLSQIQVEKGWEITGGSEDVIIAYLDTGIDTNHQDLAAKIIDGYNAFDESNEVHDHHGHGTHVAGIIGALTNNETGIAGVSWKNPIMPIKVLNEKGEGSLFEVANGIYWATDNGAKVINMSLGDTEPSQMLYDAVRYAYERDVVLIGAAGNDNVGHAMYPAGYDEVLAISAVNRNEEKAIFSNYGQHIDVAAPGEEIPSTFLDDQYVFMSGTSMAAPHVAGLAGLVRSIRPDLSNDEVAEVIRQTARDLGYNGKDQYYGYGQIDVAATLDNIGQQGDGYQGNGKANQIEQEKEQGQTWIEKWIDHLFNQPTD